tara:strand:- start:1464 stop:2051 length:588 start_codon:yes stop_codon:yes gene_type:complete
MKTGVYQIRNLKNGHCYIGSTSLDFKERWRIHLGQLKRGEHHSIVLQRAWNKHGADSFKFEVLIYCDSEDCLMYEQITLDYYKPLYNIGLDATSPMRGRKHTEASKQKISQALAGNQHAKGRRYSQSEKDNMSNVIRNLGNLGDKNPSSKLTEQNVATIKRLLRRGCKQLDIAKRFSVSKSMISAINKGRRRVVK